MLLPVDILTSILVRLPVRSLLLFRSVSKTWQEMIDDQISVSLHVNSEITSGKKRPTSFFLSTDRFQDHLELYFAEQQEEDVHMFKATKLTLSLPETIKIEQFISVDAARGLLAVRYFAPSVREGNDIFYDFICNPFTGQLLNLPVVVSHEHHGGRLNGGFGYDPSTRKFKLLRVYTTWVIDRKETEVLIFTLGSKSWKRLENIPDEQIPGGPSVSIDNMLHWFSLRDEYLLTFDIASETFGSIQLPESRSSSYRGNLENLDGCLSITDDCLEDRIEVWVMKEYGKTESWTRIVILRGDYDNADYVLGLQPVSFLNNIEILLLCDAKALKVHNVESGIRTPCHILGLTGSPRFTAYSYCGNLLSLRSAEHKNNLEQLRTT